MKDAKLAVYNVLTGDETLLAMLGSNAPFNDPKGTKNTAHSVIPAGFASIRTKTPFITIQGGPRVKRDPMGHYFNEFLYIRCYNDSKKSFVKIDEILERIQTLLDNSYISLADGVNVHTTLESTDTERIDEDLKMNFRESSYRIEIVL